MLRILKELTKNYYGLKIMKTWGETTLFYNPDDSLKRGTYFCTFKNNDGENDKASHLYRSNVFRMNFGISKKKFCDIFKIIPKRPAKGEIIEGDYNFQTLDILTPHPVYGWMAWISILNPSDNSLKDLKNLINESYTLCIQKHKKKISIK